MDFIYNTIEPSISISDIELALELVDSNRMLSTYSSISSDLTLDLIEGVLERLDSEQNKDRKQDKDKMEALYTRATSSLTLDLVEGVLDRISLFGDGNNEFTWV